MKKQELKTFLELKFPADTTKSAYATKELFGLLHDLSYGPQKTMSLEIVSNKNEGIRYVIGVSENDVSVVKRTLISYLPGLQVHEISDYLENFDSKSDNPDAGLKRKERKTYGVIEFKLSDDFALPLNTQKVLMEHDPVSFLSGNMTKLSEGELIVFQIVATSTAGPEVREHIKKIKNDIYEGKLLSPVISKKEFRLFNIPIIILLLVSWPLGLTLIIVRFILYKLDIDLTPKNKIQTLSNLYEQEFQQVIKEKLGDGLFNTSIRIFILTKNEKEFENRKTGLISSFNQFKSPYQSLVPQKSTIIPFFSDRQFSKRIKDLVNRKLKENSLILSASELSDLFHFPYTRTTKTEDMAKIYSTELAAPLSLKKEKKFDVIFAKNTYGGVTTMIGLTEEERRRHVYILGGTGRGKSTLLLGMIREDLKNGKGLCVIDPHGDLIEKVLPLIPEERMKNVIYFNPDDIRYPAGLNLLQLSEGLNEEDTLREKEFIAESVVSLFKKIYDDKYSGPRMEYILRNAIHTALTTKNPTLFTIYKLLINTPYRNRVVNALEDLNLRDFWNYEFARAGDFQKVKMISPITNKIGRFLFSPTGKRILEQEKSTIDFDEILNSGKILLCNLSKGKIGEDNSEIFGTLVLARIQLAAMKRARIEVNEREDFYLYVDEFQNFATPSFAQILSEARKYKLNAILAHQTTSQVKDKTLVNITLANVGTVICFRTANPEDERLILPQFAPNVSLGEISNLPTYHFYIKINALDPQEPFSGETVQVEVNTNKEKVNRIIETSREKYTHRYIDNIEVNKITKKGRVSKANNKDNY